MPHHKPFCASLAFGILALLLTPARSVSAHEMKTIGPFHLMIGWGDEPAFGGLKNSVEVDISEAGMPVIDIGGSLSVEVIFGEARVMLPLLPARERPGKLRAWLVPTRPGTYAFHITGMVKGQPIDITSTCSSRTFSCVEDVSDVQFPVKDPSTGQLAERVGRDLPRAERATETATTARNVGFGAIALALLALGATLRRGRRTGANGGS
jgi:hypothetical protein